MLHMRRKITSAFLATHKQSSPKQHMTVIFVGTTIRTWMPIGTKSNMALSRLPASFTLHRNFSAKVTKTQHSRAELEVHHIEEGFLSNDRHTSVRFIAQRKEHP